MYFQIQNILKNNRNYISKQTILKLVLISVFEDWLEWCTVSGISRFFLYDIV